MEDNIVHFRIRPGDECCLESLRIKNGKRDWTRHRYFGLWSHGLESHLALAARADNREISLDELEAWISEETARWHQNVSARFYAVDIESEGLRTKPQNCLRLACKNWFAGFQVQRLVGNDWRFDAQVFRASEARTLFEKRLAAAQERNDKARSPQGIGDAIGKGEISAPGASEG